VVWVNEHKKDVSSAKRLFDTGIIFTEMQPQERKRLKDFLSSTLFL
jgi:hypothetical protein